MMDTPTKKIAAPKEAAKEKNLHVNNTKSTSVNQRGHGHHDAIANFKMAIATTGITPPSEIVADGAIHRFASRTKKNNKDGWYVFYDGDIPAGVFGCWKAGISQTWRTNINRELTPEEKRQYAKQMAEAKEKAELARKEAQDQASNQAMEIWNTSKDVDPNHPYLLRKDVRPYGIRQDGDDLIIPLRIGQDIYSIQRIFPSGDKRFLKNGRIHGCYFLIGEIQEKKPLCICEGYATGASIHKATKYPVAVAFHAGNLKAVAEYFRKFYPEQEIIICADDDFRTDNNPGLAKARDAASVVGAIVAIPSFGDTRSNNETDFNDLRASKGLDAVKDCIDQTRTTTNGVISLVRASDMTIKPIEWLWLGWLPYGKMTILSGAAGTGKTTLALKIAATITAGDIFPDGTQSQSGNVLIWSGEDAAEDTLIPRLIASGADPKKCFFPLGNLKEKRSFNISKDIHLLDDAIKKIGGASLLIIDPIINTITNDMNMANHVRLGLQPIVDFADRNNCAVLGITHFTKNSAGKNPLDRTIGSQAFGAFARVVLSVAKDDTTDRRVLTRVKSNIGEDTGGYTYSLKQGALHGYADIKVSYAEWGNYIDGSAREILASVERSNTDGQGSKLEEAEEFLLDILHDGEVYSEEVNRQATVKGISGKTLKRARKKLGVKSRKASMMDGWFLSLPDV